MNINLNSLFTQCRPFLILFTFVYLLHVALLFVLPSMGINYVEESYGDLDYQNYALYKSVRTTPKPVVVKKVAIREYDLISGLVLSAVYAQGDMNGWAIVQEKASLKTHVLKRGASFKGYVLKSLFSGYVIFQKNATKYKLHIARDNHKVEIKEDNAQTIFFDQGKVKIKRTFLNSYTSDIKKIWRNIKLSEFKNKQGQVQGFKVSKVANNSIFSKLGLSNGDILTGVNNIKVTNYRKVLTLYKNINNIRSLNIRVLRNNKEMDLNYEIH